MPGYTLVVAKCRPRLKETKADEEHKRFGSRVADH
jgi:hypothetical protein